MRSTIRRLPYSEWPQQDRHLWESVFENGNIFQDGTAAHLAEASRKSWKSCYSRFLGFLAARHPDRLMLPPDQRVAREIVKEYSETLLAHISQVTVAIMLGRLGYVLKAIHGEYDWSWLQQITARIRRGAKPSRKPYITADRLFALGMRLMDRALAEANADGLVTEQGAIIYRDGLMIALVASAPIRRRALLKMEIGRQLVRTGSGWTLDIPEEDTKTGQPQEYPLAPRLSGYVDEYLARFRSAIPGAGCHDSLWPSSEGKPMAANTCLQRFTVRTRAEFGFAVGPHRFRHAAATLWSERDPKNVRGAKDLLGHTTFAMTEKHYIVAQSRTAGQKLAQAFANA